MTFMWHLISKPVGLSCQLLISPKAIGSGSAHSHGGEEENEAAADERILILKGLVGLSGIYFFFLAEKLVSTISEYRTEKAAEKV